MSSVFTKLRLREWRGAARAAGTALVCTPPLPHPFTSLIFICAHFLSWPWMELSSCSVQLYVYWIYSIVSHCACVSIQETASAFLEEQLLSAQALKREINQLVSSDWFWGGKKKGLSNCWLLNVSLAIFNSLLETYILWEFILITQGSQGTETGSVSLWVDGARYYQQKHLETKTWAIRIKIMF